MIKNIFKIAKEVVDLASFNKVVIASAESCTGGMLTSALTSVPGSSVIFDCGFITYSNNSKMKLLNVYEDTLTCYGAVSEETASELSLIHI